MNVPKDIFISEEAFRKRYDYNPEDLLGEGGFAQVYKAYDKQFEEYVALKFYNKGEQGKYDVLHEMKDSRSYSHKNIIRVYDAFIVRFEQRGVYSYVQVGVIEYANGGNLKDFLETEPSEQSFRKVLIGILNALDYLHTEKNLIHRDLSPENILMYKEGEKWIPKIADFGISKRIEYEAKNIEQKRSTQLLGKPDYMAPEQFEPDKFGINGKINTNVDLWSFGIMLYETFQEDTPFGGAGANPMKIIHSITREPLPAIKEIPEPYQKIISRCLVKNARKRVQSAREIIALFESKHKTKKTDYSKTIALKEIDVPKRSYKKILVPLLFVLILVGGYFIINGILSTRVTSSDKISTINLMMEEKNYEGAQEVFSTLSRKSKKDPEISILNDQCALWDYVGQDNNNQAISYYESLPENIKMNPDVREPYQIASVNVATDELNRLYESKDYITGREYYLRLDSFVRADPGITVLAAKTSNELLVDSLIIAGIALFDEDNLKESKATFAKVLKRSDPDHPVASAYLQRIDRKENQITIPDPEQVSSESTSVAPSVPSTPECPVFYAENLEMESRPNPNEIKLLDVCITENEMKIKLELQPSIDIIDVWSPGAWKSFYISYGIQKTVVPLQKLDGWDVGRIVEEPTVIELTFGPLPDGISEFSLIEGKESNRHGFWDFINIKLPY